MQFLGLNETKTTEENQMQMAPKPPLLGFGTFLNFANHDKMATAVKLAIKEGYRHFDLAMFYENEKEIGEAIRECISEGIVSRADLFLCSKIWCSELAPEDVEPALRKTLSKLGLDYVDNYMMHWPQQWKKDYKRTATGIEYEIVHTCDHVALLESWVAMEKLVDQGLTRSLGVSNFNVAALRYLLEESRIKPLMNQIELHPYLAQPELVDFCQRKDVHVVAYCPLAKGKNIMEDETILLEDPVIKGIAKDLGRSPAQVVLKWLIQRGISVIPKTINPAHIKDNAKILDWCLTKKEMKLLNTLDRGHRYCQVPWFDFDLYDNPGDRSRNRTLSQPGVEQPLYKEGEIDSDGVYHNNFSRPGKPLSSDIFLKRGIIRNLDVYIKKILPAVSLNANNFLITDAIVDQLLDVDNSFIAAMKRVGISCHKIIVPADSADEAGETSVEPYKTTDVFHTCAGQIMANRPSKHSCVISVGGGVVNNLCGVLAGMIYRGIGLVHFTTTTMGMLDAALDFKQAINHDMGKNLLGCYYPASTVVIDPECAASLSTRHVRNGIAEALKHAFCQSTDMIDMIVEPVKEHGEEVMHNPDYLEQICKECIEIKVPTLDNYNDTDYNEMCPQYGHAVGHAVEYLSWHKPHEPLLHGECVAIGMCVSSEIALARGYCDQSTVDKHYDSCLSIGLPAFVPKSMTTEAVLNKMMYDKHYVKVPSMGLCSACGEMSFDPVRNCSFAFEVTNDELVAAIAINRKKAELAGQ